MMTQVNYAQNQSSDLDEKDLEILHMIAFEYELNEIVMESKLTIDEIIVIISKLYKHLEVNSEAGLVRAAFEKRLLLLW